MFLPEQALQNCSHDFSEQTEAVKSSKVGQFSGA
jgi:hypothetical protein